MEECIRNGKRVLWWGATENEYGWLIEKIAQYRSLQTPEIELETAVGSFEQLPAILESQQVDRLIVACCNRWDYPHHQLQQLAYQFPEIPIALAVGDWWLGWRRTGVGHLQLLPHLSLPWYRWRDGWIQWLDGSISTMFGPFPSERVVVDLDSDWAEQAPSKMLVWDDSQLATWMGWEASLSLAVDQLTQLQQQNPGAKLCIRWTLPTWELVTRLRQAGLSFELLAKPHLSSFSSAALART